MKRKIYYSIIAALLSVAAYAEDSIAVTTPDTTVTTVTGTAKPKKPKKQIYEGTQLKFDILSPILTPALNQWKIQHYELAVNVQLAHRFYPALELGYATKGGFARIGCDINPLKKHPDSPHALLVGVRIATAVQEKAYTDCWGEIVVGCQVEIAKVNNTAFYMGWMGRLKFLFTHRINGTADPAYPAFIPGYGAYDNMGWGANYYLGWRF